MKPRDPIYFALIGAAQLLIFFNNPGHFFMGDTLLWMGLRYRSITEFLAGFVQTDPALWYRPLAQRTLISLLYPLAGLHPIPYRLVTFLLFFACTISVFVVTQRITESRRAAWLATLFFALQITHTFTTYDAAFYPEMLFTLFCVGSVIAYVAYVRTHNPSQRVLSVVLFICGLLSKETAITLPFVLLAVWLLLPTVKRVPLRSLIPHFAVMLLYLIFAIGYLHIQHISLSQLIDRPGRAGQPGYQLVVGENIPFNTRWAVSWAFNVSRGYLGRWEVGAPWMLWARKAIRILILVAAFLALWSPRRRLLFLGIAWFFLAAAPMLPLLDHFLPYYLFAPLVGFSLAVGTALDAAYERIAKLSSPLACATCALLFATTAGINLGSATRLVRDRETLGASAAGALAAMNDLHALYPNLQSGTTLVIFNEENDYAPWDHANGQVFQMAYRDETIRTQYSSLGITVSADDLKSGKILVFKLAQGHLIDITASVEQYPELLRPPAPNEILHLQLSRTAVRIEGEPIVLRIPELKNEVVSLLWAHEGAVEKPVRLTLNDRGQADLSIPRGTEPGTYAFLGLQRSGASSWVTVSGSIRIDAEETR